MINKEKKQIKEGKIIKKKSKQTCFVVSKLLRPIIILKKKQMYFHSFMKTKVRDEMNPVMKIAVLLQQTT